MILHVTVVVLKNEIEKLLGNQLIKVFDGPMIRPHFGIARPDALGRPKPLDVLGKRH
jgi:hypothetical protein